MRAVRRRALHRETPVPQAPGLGAAAQDAHTSAKHYNGVQADCKIDGVDGVPFTNGQAEQEGRETTHERLFWRSGASQTAFVDGWKLNVSEPGDGYETRKWLFDLRNDPTEQNDLAPTHPDKLAELEAALAAQNAEQAPSMWSSTMSFAVAIDKDGSVAESPDDEYVYWSN